MMPTLKWVTGNCFVQPGDEDLRAHPVVQPCHEPASIERGHGAEKRQDRQSDDEREHPRQNQNLHRIEAHRAKRVDLLAHLHGPKLRRVRAAGTPRHHDGHKQHADLAQDQNADHVDDIVFGPEPAEVEETLLGDDAADQEGNQHDDGRGLPADAIELMHQRGEAEVSRAAENARGSDADGPEHVQERQEAARLLCDSALKLAESRDQAAPFGLRGFLFLIDGMNVLKKPLVFLAQAYDPGLLPGAGPFPDQPLQKPSPVCIKRSDIAHIDRNVASLRGLIRRPADRRFKFAGVDSRPGPRCQQLEAAVMRSGVQGRCCAHGCAPQKLRAEASIAKI